MKKQATISITDCSGNKLQKLAAKCGFFIFQGKKHSKVKDSKGRTVTLIPRHSKLKKELVRGIIKDLNAAGCRFKIVSK